MNHQSHLHSPRKRDSDAEYCCFPSYQHAWWRNHMETFPVLLALCAGNSPVTGDFPSQRPVPRNFDVFCDLRLNKRLSKQTGGWWLETPLRLLWRHCNVNTPSEDIYIQQRHMRTCMLEASVKGRYKWSHPTVSVGCDFLFFLPLISASGMQVLILY